MAPEASGLMMVPTEAMEATQCSWAVQIWGSLSGRGEHCIFWDVTQWDVSEEHVASIFKDYMTSSKYTNG
jgi:hypothetical protein